MLWLWDTNLTLIEDMDDVQVLSPLWVCAGVTCTVLTVVLVELDENRGGHHQEIPEGGGGRVGHDWKPLTETPQALREAREAEKTLNGQNNYPIVNSACMSRWHVPRCNSLDFNILHEAVYCMEQEPEAEQGIGGVREM